MVRKIKNIPRSIKYGIQNLIKWFPIIWKDRDWDHWYLYKTLQFKLIQMEKLQREHGVAVSSEKIAGQIQTCVNLLDRLIEDEYHEMVFKNHDKKWGKSHFNWTDCKDKEGYSKLHITRDNVKTDKDKEQERKEFIRYCKNEEELKKQDLDYLFKTMNKYIQGWWD